MVPINAPGTILRGPFVSTPHKLTAGRIILTHWLAPLPPALTAFRGLQLRGAHPWRPGKASIQFLVPTNAVGTIHRGLWIASPRSLVRGRIILPKFGAPPPVILAGLPLRGLLIASPRHLWPGKHGGVRFALAVVAQPPFELRQAVVAWLGALPALTALVQGRIYFEDPSQMSMYPCVVVQITKRTYGHNLAGPDGTSQATVQITAIGFYESQAIAIAESYRNFADGFRGVQSGVSILRCFLGDEADGATPPPDGSDSWIYQCALEYEVVHRV